MWRWIGEHLSNPAGFASFGLCPVVGGGLSSSFATRRFRFFAVASPSNTLSFPRRRLAALQGAVEFHAPLSLASGIIQCL